jgi:MFS family permease
MSSNLDKGQPEIQHHFERALSDDEKNMDHVPIPSEAEKQALIRKLDWHLLPLLFFLYSLSVLDRSNLGNAKLAGMENDIDLSGNRYSLLGTVFYIAYILFQWTIAGWKQFKPHQWCALTVLFWGTIATVQAATSSWAGLIVCRFLLGIAEAMFGPGVPLYLTFFYPREKVGFRHGVFISGAAMANAYGSALACELIGPSSAFLSKCLEKPLRKRLEADCMKLTDGISQIRGALAPWRILFLIEGLPTCVVAILAWYYIPDSITTARFLNERERQVALHMVGQNQKTDAGDTKGERGVRFGEFLAAFRDSKSFIPGLMYFCW